MNQFLVPQFIDVEPKIFGPISLRQFLVIVVGIISSVMAFKFADISLFILEFIIIVGITILFAFIKVNGQLFHFFLLNIFEFFLGSNIRVWKKEEQHFNALIDHVSDEKKTSTEKDKVSESKLSQLSLVLDTGGAYKEDEALELEDERKLELEAEELLK